MLLLVIIGFTEILTVVLKAHWDESGIKTEVIVPGTEVLIVAGIQEPIIPFIEFEGNNGGFEFRHKD